MGNHNSHGPTANGRAILGPPIQQQWAHSFPRDLQRVPHLKVLPEGGIGQRLRTTDNGAILNSEGTIRGGRSFRRNSDEFQHNGMIRSNSVHRTQHNDHQMHRGRTHHIYKDRDGNTFAAQAKRFGSEPDLRTNNNHGNSSDGFGVGAKNRISRGRKKYKAPAPPIMGDTSSPDSYHWELTSGGDTSDSAAPQRRLRLFKTRAETHKHNQSHHRSSIEERRVPEKEIHQSNGYRSDPMLETRELHESRIESKPREYVIEPPERRNRYNMRNKERFEERGEGGVLIRGREREVEVRPSKRTSAPPAIMQRSLSSPEFQAELRAVTQKLRVMDKIKTQVSKPPMKYELENKPFTNGYSNKQQKAERERNSRNEEIKQKSLVQPGQESQNNSSNSKMVTMDHHNIPAKQRLINGFRENVEKSQIKVDQFNEDAARLSKYSRESSSQESQATDGGTSRGQPSGKESTPEQSPTRRTEQRKPDDFKTPAKTFYFGMDHENEQKPVELPKILDEKITRKERNNKLNNLENMTYKLPQPSSSESALSSEPDFEETNHNGNDISMKLRPTLPKKQLDIPRFSPATAWRLLSVVDTFNQSNNPNENDDSPMLLEDRIERLSRPIPTIPLLGQRSSQDKSGDSGISGDAGPALMEDITEPPPQPILQPKMTNNRPNLVAWTPQQDLDEEASSSDGGGENTKPETPTDVRFNARSHVFSLSLPRETHLAQYAESDKSKSNQGFNSLQKLKRSLGAALATKVRSVDESPQDHVDANWFLSSSAPNSLNHTFRLSRTQSDEEDKTMFHDKEPIMLKTPSFTYLANGGHIMYLPSFEEKNDSPKTNNSDQVEIRNKKLEQPNRQRDLRAAKVKSIEIPCRKEFNRGLRKLPLSKSCDNITHEMRQLNRTPSPELKQSYKMDENSGKIHKGKGKRFTFQSTVRQIERRRIAEKLSKEAERKERQRLCELQAMQRVEEEFQRKRAREKASIRQQLRLFSMDDPKQNSPNWEHNQSRPDPDGAVSSPAPSPTNHSSKLLTKDTRTPYVNKIIEQKMSKSQNRKERNNNILDNTSKEYLRSDLALEPTVIMDKSKRLYKKDLRSSPSIRTSDDGIIKTSATEILSEYRQPTREYRDYRGVSSRFVNDGSIEQPTTVHPQVVYNMPKASHGHTFHEVCVVEGSASPHSDNYRRDFAHGAVPTSSDSELSQPNTRSHSPRHIPRLRARSLSPAGDREIIADNGSNLQINETSFEITSAEKNSNALLLNSSNIQNIESVLVTNLKSENQKIIANLNNVLTIEIDNSHVDSFTNQKFNFEVEQEMQHISKSPLSTLHPQPFTPGKSYKPIVFKTNNLLSN